jgi:phenylpyruvate tautomerase PptA (4-oxalocrotonate tautomerase family)
MPSTLISVRKFWPAAQRRKIIEAVHSALVEAIRIPEQDRCLRLRSFDGEDFAVSPSQSENFTLVEIDLFVGRSLTAKKALYRTIVRNLGALGIAAADVKVLLRESAPDNWGIRGGQAASDVTLGFKVEV